MMCFFRLQQGASVELFNIMIIIFCLKIGKYNGYDVNDIDFTMMMIRLYVNDIDGDDENWQIKLCQGYQRIS